MPLWNNLSSSPQLFQTSPRFGRRIVPTPYPERENSISPNLNECSQRDSRRNNVRESFIYLNILEEVIELADRTNNLKLRVIDAFRDDNCENCNFSEHGICRSHRYGSGVYNNRSNLVHPISEEQQELTETLMNILDV